MSVHRKLRSPLKAYRIGDAAGGYPVYSGIGASRFPGRWNKSGEEVIYSSEHYSTAVLEKLVRLGEMPGGQHFVEMDIPAGVSYEVVTGSVVPRWYEKNARSARKFGSRWFREIRSAILLVPSVIARVEQNILIHPQHPDFAKITPGLETPIWWDRRLFVK